MKDVLPTEYWPSMSTMGFASKSEGPRGGDPKCEYFDAISRGSTWWEREGGKGEREERRGWEETRKKCVRRGGVGVPAVTKSDCWHPISSYYNITSVLIVFSSLLLHSNATPSVPLPPKQEHKNEHGNEEPILTFFLYNFFKPSNIRSLSSWDRSDPKSTWDADDWGGAPWPWTWLGLAGSTVWDPGPSSRDAAISTAVGYRGRGGERGKGREIRNVEWGVIYEGR